MRHICEAYRVKWEPTIGSTLETNSAFDRRKSDYHNCVCKRAGVAIRSAENGGDESMWPSFLSKPTCPIEEPLQKWVDGRFKWLEETLGRDTARRARVILPTPEFFPDVYEGRPDDAQAMLTRIAGYMNVNPQRFRLFLYSENREVSGLGIGHSSSSGTAGVYIGDDGTDPHGNPRASIGIESAQLADPESLVATLAHEIGHEILLGRKLVTPDQQDHEPLTDLLTVFLGLGVFTANATIRDRAWTSGTLAGWQTKRLGYLNQRTFGYALALFAHARNEAKPTWLKHVRPDVRAPLKSGLRFLDHSSR